MDTQHIPDEILDNLNFDWDNEERIRDINDTFCKIHSLDIGVKRSKDYKNLIKEINGRYDAEMLVKTRKARRIEVAEELRVAQAELQCLKDKISSK